MSTILSATKQTVFSLLTVALVSVSLSATAADKDNGEALSTSKGCVGCHAVDGNSVIPTNPILAGQYEDYLVHALKQYKSGERQNAIMAGFARGLTDKEIADLAAWFASNESKLEYVKQ